MDGRRRAWIRGRLRLLAEFLWCRRHQLQLQLRRRRQRHNADGQPRCRRPPRWVRPYASGGSGSFDREVDNPGQFFDKVRRQDFGMDVGGGVMFLAANVGVGGTSATSVAAKQRSERRGPRAWQISVLARDARRDVQVLSLRRRLAIPCSSASAAATHRDGSIAASVSWRRKRRRDRLPHIGIEEWRVAPPLFDRQIIEGPPFGDEPANQRADDFVRLAKRQPLATR